MAAPCSLPSMVSSAKRVVAVDAARGVALLAMFATHLYPHSVDDAPHPAFVIAAGRASAAFVMLAGLAMSLSLFDRDDQVKRGAWAAVLTRSAMVIAVGSALADVSTGVAVILVQYGVWFGLAIPFLYVSTRLTLAAGVGLLTLGPFLSFAVRNTWQLTPEYLPVGVTDMVSQPASVAQELWWTGYYPTVPWVGYLLLGLALGRLWRTRPARIPQATVAGLLFGVGLALVGVRLVCQLVVAFVVDTDSLTIGAPYAVPGWGWTEVESFGFYGVLPFDDWRWLAASGPHSGTVLDALDRVGSTLILLGLLHAIAQAAPWGRRVLAPLRGCGAMTFTLYVVHVLTFWDIGVHNPQMDSWVPSYPVHCAVAMTVGLVWSVWLHRRGPLEALMHMAATRVQHVVANSTWMTPKGGNGA